MWIRACKVINVFDKPKFSPALLLELHKTIANYFTKSDIEEFRLDKENLNELYSISCEEIGIKTRSLKRSI